MTNERRYTVDGALREWVHTIIITGWLAWLTITFTNYKDEANAKMSRIDKDVVKVSAVEKDVDEIKRLVRSMDARMRSVEIASGK